MSTRWWIGTYGPDTQDGSGAGVYEATAEADSFAAPRLIAELASPTWLRRRGDEVWAALEGSEAVAILRDPDGSPVRRIPSGGGWPCHLTVLGEHVVVTAYADGRVVLLGERGPVQTLEADGSGPRPEQDGPHAHASLVLGDTLLTADLGADLVRVHRIAGDRLERTGGIAFPPGTGPRDLSLLPDGGVLVLGELDGTLHLLRDGAIAASAAMPGWVEGDHAAAIGIRGPFVYAGVRGSDRIAVLRLDGDALTPVIDVATGGRWPRHLAVDGARLHVANQHSHDVTTFRIGDDGIPVRTGSLAVPSPAFLLPLD